MLMQRVLCHVMLFSVVINVRTEAQSVMWQAPDACAQPYHPGSDNHGQLLRLFRLFLDTAKFRK